MTLMGKLRAPMDWEESSIIVKVMENMEIRSESRNLDGLKMHKQNY